MTVAAAAAVAVHQDAGREVGAAVAEGGKGHRKEQHSRVSGAYYREDALLSAVG